MQRFGGLGYGGWVRQRRPRASGGDAGRGQNLFVARPSHATIANLRVDVREHPRPASVASYGLLGHARLRPAALQRIYFPSHAPFRNYTGVTIYRQPWSAISIIDYFGTESACHDFRTRECFSLTRCSFGL